MRASSSPLLASSPFPLTIMHSSQTRSQIQTLNISSRSDSGHPNPNQLRCCCPCGSRSRRRHTLIGFGSTLLLPPNTSIAHELTVSEVVDKFHPPRPDWYQEFYAQAMHQGMQSYEAQITGFKEEIFVHLSKECENVVELGVGTGPNFKYYVNGGNLNVIGVDPNQKMERYARAAALAAGLPPENFTFLRGVGEALPLDDNSMDAVIGTLVLCSVKDVDIALNELRRVLKPGGLYIFIEHVSASDGSLLRLMQNLLDPLQQLVSDGCHLTRETGRQISEETNDGTIYIKFGRCVTTLPVFVHNHCSCSWLGKIGTTVKFMAYRLYRSIGTGLFCQMDESLFQALVILDKVNAVFLSDN